MDQRSQSFGGLLREWRQRRRYSQLALASEADISQRHLSFMESGRSLPSREMIIRLAEHLAIPLRARSELLAAAGFASVYAERPLTSPAMTAAMGVVRHILQANAPNPALAVDRHWTLQSANQPMESLLDGVSPDLLQGEVNILRLTFHPNGLAARILNFRAWRHHILTRLSRDIELSADPKLKSLRDEIRSYPVPHHLPSSAREAVGADVIAVPLILDSREGPLEFLSATTVFGTAEDVTLAGLVIESFYPATAETAASLARLAQSSPKAR